MIINHKVPIFAALHHKRSQSYILELQATIKAMQTRLIKRLLHLRQNSPRTLPFLLSFLQSGSHGVPRPRFMRDSPQVRRVRFLLLPIRIPSNGRTRGYRRRRRRCRRRRLRRHTEFHGGRTTAVQQSLVLLGGYSYL